MNGDTFKGKFVNGVRTGAGEFRGPSLHYVGEWADDNATGSAGNISIAEQMMAARPRRSLIFVWDSGEEQGLLGSRAYVTQHFADRATMALKPAHAKFSSYYNVDNGTGAIIEFSKSSEEPLELLVNNKTIAVGQTVKVGENFGIRLTTVGDVKQAIYTWRKRFGSMRRALLGAHDG